ncbi:hypothetical protein ACQUFY_08495 [Robbsia andropogonis]|uniref:hypothetical protein n=1 Tax=Robbsia andropogonis TaxID=28092 RepID=UPI003D240850
MSAIPRIDLLPKILEQIGELTKRQVLVGIPDGAPSRQDTPQSNAQIGYLQETGSPANNIPARPFLVPGVADVQEQVAEILQGGVKEALSGRAALPRMHGAGMVAQGAVRRKITNGPFQDLAPATIAARQARGRTGTKPLIDTGQLRNSITYVVREK